MREITTGGGGENRELPTGQADFEIKRDREGKKEVR